jgi:hypothetical protein
VTSVDNHWQDWDQRHSLVSLCQGDEELACLLFRVYGERVIGALDEGAQAFDGATPRKLLRDKKGRQKLRRALMKFPYI